MGEWKKRKAACNRWHRGYALTRKRAHFHLVQPSLDGCLCLSNPEGMHIPSGAVHPPKGNRGGKHEKDW